MNMKLTIQSGNTLYEPPIESGVQIEWERSGSPGKLTFTTLKVEGLAFQEGDQVCFYYNNKLVFVGYVFKKSRDKEHHIKVTCYDQIRYLKNKYTYVFEKKTATQIVKALCNDFGLALGEFDNTNYVIPAIAEENKSALDIILDVLDETLLNTGNMFVLYDESGKLRIRNVENMMSTTLIYEDTAENFDYSSSIDDETYNNVVLYYKDDNNGVKLFTASSPSTVKQWGLLRYFEEVKTPTIGQNKANALLKLYNKKTRELKVSGAFGDISVRGGTLIPVKLYLGDISANNFMLVEKVTHKFDNDHHTMDLTLEGAWEDNPIGDIVSQTITTGSSSSNATTPTNSTVANNTPTVTNTVNPVKKQESYTFNVKVIGGSQYAGIVIANCTYRGESRVVKGSKSGFTLKIDANTTLKIRIEPKDGHSVVIENGFASFENGAFMYHKVINEDGNLIIRWVN